MFTPMLRDAYRAARPENSEVVFVSSDRSSNEQLAYMREAHGDWPAVRAGSHLAQTLSSNYGVRGIPSLIVINASDGSVITRDGRQDIQSRGASAFSYWETMAKPIESAMDTSAVKMLEDNEPHVIKEAGEILLKLIGNVLRDPHNMKYRSVRLSNPKIESKLLVATGAFEILFAAGFEEDTDSLLLPLDASLTKLRAIKAALEKIMWGRGGEVPNPGEERQQQPQERKQPTKGNADAVVMQSQSEAEFFAKLEADLVLAQTYEDKSNQEAALNCIPRAELEKISEEKFESLKAKDPMTKPSLKRDILLLELLRWFKEEFFSWVDSPASCCEKDGGTTRSKGMLVPTPQEQSDGAGRVEGYVCSLCSAEVRFPRYHSRPAKLLETRRGRCGEWANAFALCCRALGFDTRRALDWTDHVWVEVFSEAEGRWLHADPCEGCCDKPLVYEVGWGKKLSYVIAISKDEVQDVTWRYSADHAALKTRRTLVREQWLTAMLLKLTNKCQESYGESTKRGLTERRLRELVDLMSPKDKSKLTKEELLGRQSGSAAWRTARGELGLGTAAPANIVWRLTQEEKDSLTFHLEYDIVKDEYYRPSASNCSKIKGWASGVSEASNIFRKVEHDWGMMYLARTEGSSKSSISWELNLDESELTVKSIELDVNSTTFENGRVVWQLCGGNACLLPSPGSTMKSEGLAGSKKVTLTAMLSGGKGNLAWQHTQLMRAKKDKPEEGTKLRIVVKLQSDSC